MRKLESEKIAEALRSELEAGRWKAGERLPSVAELRERFGVGVPVGQKVEGAAD